MKTNSYMILKRLVLEMIRGISDNTLLLQEKLQTPLQLLLRGLISEADFVSLQKKSFVDRTDRTNLFVDKLEKGEAIDLTNGSKAVIDKVVIDGEEFTKGSFDQLKEKLPTLTSKNKLKFYSGGKSYNISAFAKTTELGGKGKGGTLGPERKVLSALQKQFEEIGGSVTLKIGNRVYKGITGVQNVKENQKADFMFTGDTPVYVSYKPGNSPRDMISYGGVTAMAAKSATVASFIDAVKKKTTTFKDHGAEYSIPLDPETDQSLILKAMYGSQVGEGGGENNVQVILQGNNISLKEEGKDTYSLTYSHVILRPEIPAGEYAPVLNARYAGDRNQFGIEKCRVGVIPAGARPGAKDPFK